MRLSRGDLAAPRLLIALVLDKTAHPLRGVALAGDTLTIDDHVCQLERIILRAPNRQVFVLVRDLDGARPDHVEPLLFHHSFFLPFFDYAKSAPWSDQPAFGRKAKPGFLAVFTHAFDEGDMLRIWAAHHARLAGARNLYVLDHGSTTALREMLPPEATVVPLPRGLVDHAEIARFCGQFQRFLLSQYRWVLHTDVDELIVDEAGEEALRHRLELGLLQGILEPEHALEIIHDVRSEPALKPGEPVSVQRRLALPAGELMRKPVLADQPVSWLQGFHQVYEEGAVRAAPGLWLIHLHAADARLLREKNRRWNAAAQTEADRLISPQNRPEDKEGLARWYGEKLGDERLAPLPEVLKGRF